MAYGCDPGCEAGASVKKLEAEGGDSETQFATPAG
jgi:hypothetical protein